MSKVELRFPDPAVVEAAASEREFGLAVAVDLLLADVAGCRSSSWPPGERERLRSDLATLLLDFAALLETDQRLALLALGRAVDRRAAWP